jgi:hypothetical protein
MPALPHAESVPDPVPPPPSGQDRVPIRRRTSRPTADIVPFRQEEDVLRSFFAGSVEPTPQYGMTRRTRATLVALGATGAGGAFIAAALQLLPV